MKAINTHIDNADVCYAGCYALDNILIGCAALQKEACEKGSLAVLLRVLKEHSDSERVSEMCCSATGKLLLSPEMHSKYCTPEVIKAVEECSKKTQRLCTNQAISSQPQERRRLKGS